MKLILDHIEKAQRGYIPQTPSDFFVLQLARGLSDTAAITNYLDLIYGQADLHLSAAYRRLAKRGIPLMPLPHFAAELEHGRFQGPSTLPDVVGVRIERRVIGLVLLGRGGIIRVETRELSWEQNAALRTTEAFLRQCLSWCGQSTIALEMPGRPNDGRRKRLLEVAKRVIRGSGLPIWEVDRANMLPTFAEPPPKSMQAVRRIAARIFPTLSGDTLRTNTLLDAACLALYVHVVRQFAPGMDS